MQSPDDIFAAHFWPWPDPAVKRDAYGRVLFVNAAFLQLFGGSVEAWRGQTLSGWAAPVPGSGSNRFEVRMPATPELPEQVFDFVEQVAEDGSAFALARNVTHFAAQPAPPPPAAQAEPQTPSFTAETSHAAVPVDAALYAPTPDQTPQPVAADPVAAAPRSAAPEMSQPAVETPATPDPILPTADNTPEPTPEATPTAFAMPDESPAAPTMEQPAATMEVETPDVDPAPAMNISAPAEAPAPVAAAPEEPDRAYERRTLPVESGDAVLGNNWRDAVIAKAIGATDDSEANETEQAADTSAAPAPAADGASGPIKILLAEDNAINALLTRTLLEAEGHTVETVEDGQLAVEAVKTQRFDLIFMDMRMPNMDGLEATRKIRAMPTISDSLPIIALTANAFDDDRNACFDSGMNDFMTKPVSAEELSEMVARWTGQGEQKLAS